MLFKRYVLPIVKIPTQAKQFKHKETKRTKPETKLEYAEAFVFERERNEQMVKAFVNCKAVNN